MGSIDEKKKRFMSRNEKKHQFYLDIALACSRHAKCLRGNFGAVIVKDDIIIGTGYNGPARGVEHCRVCKRINSESGFGYGDCPSVHAEVNAIINAGGRKECIGATLYLDSYNRTPETKYNSGEILLACDQCARTMVNAGIEWYVCRTEDRIVVCHIPTFVKMGLIK